MLPGRQLPRAAAVLALVLTTATPAQAASGVFINPGGPACKEYSLQLPAARNIGAGGGGSQAGQGQTALAAPLFGVGITPPHRALARRGRASGRNAGGRTFGSTGSRSSQGLNRFVLARVRSLEQQGSGSALGDELLLCAAVVAAGAAGGLGLARARRGPSDA
jgi:hypothetical protein